MNDNKPHIFVRNPDRKKNTCWSCEARKEEHRYFIHHPMLDLPVVKTRKKGNARSVRSKPARIRAVR